jgi:hypothetical protein
MTTYFQSTGLAFPLVEVGQDVVPDLDTAVFYYSEKEFDLEARALALWQFITAHRPVMGIQAAHLGGCGDGNSFVLMVQYTAGDSYVSGAPADVNSGGTKLFFWRAASKHEIDVQIDACYARIVAWLSQGTNGHEGAYIDQQMAGGAKGQPFMGMFLVIRTPISPPH